MAPPKTTAKRGLLEEIAAEASAQADHRCQCGVFGCFGFRKRWWCKDCVPDEFWCWPGSTHPIAVTARETANTMAAVAELKTTLDLPLMTGRR